MHFKSFADFSFLQIFRLLRSMPTPTLRFIHLTRYIVISILANSMIMYSLNMWQYLTMIFILFGLCIFQSQYPRLVVEDFKPLPSKGNTGKDAWYAMLFYSVLNLNLTYASSALVVYDLLIGFFLVS